MKPVTRFRTPDQIVVCVGGEASIVAIRKTLGTFIYWPWITTSADGDILVTMQDVVNEINKMNRALAHRLCMEPESECASQVIVCTRNR